MRGTPATQVDELSKHRHFGEKQNANECIYIAAFIFAIPSLTFCDKHFWLFAISVKHNAKSRDFREKKSFLFLTRNELLLLLLFTCFHFRHLIFC